MTPSVLTPSRLAFEQSDVLINSTTSRPLVDFFPPFATRGVHGWSGGMKMAINSQRCWERKSNQRVEAESDAEDEADA